MDPDRFDSLAKRLITPTTRRATFGASAGGLLSAFGLGRTVPETRAAQGRTCKLAFAATVRLGPSVDHALTPDGPTPGELRGELRFALSNIGTLENGALLLPNGTRFPVVGQATGYGLQLRIELEPRVALVAVGVGERQITDCTGVIDGVVTGPQVGDLGDWHAATSDQDGGTGATNSADSSNGQRGGAQAATVATTTARTGGSSGRSRTNPAEPTPASGSGGAAAACASGLTRCGSECVDLNVERNHCGACGAVCKSDLVAVACRSGVCERAGSACPEGQADCGEGCTDLSRNNFHCGACGKECDGDVGQVCQGGVCTGATCTGGLTDCAGSCVDLQTNPYHCGTCATVCPGADTDANPCIGGRCVDQCTAHGLTDCPGGCRDLSSDPANCGVCGNACQGGSCLAGVCTGGALQCTSGLTDCGGVCVDTTNDAVNCGACGLECAYGETCGGGTCQSRCAAGQNYCNGACVDTASDPANCGFCGNPCGGFSECVSGACINTAVELPGSDLNCAVLGLTDCGGVCVDLLTDDLNCGSCGNRCDQLAGYCLGDGTCCACCRRPGDPSTEPLCSV
jgi:hypothetical protein